jgi:hypothetical protein
MAGFLAEGNGHGKHGKHGNPIAPPLLVFPFPTTMGTSLLAERGGVVGNKVSGVAVLGSVLSVFSVAISR